MSNTCKYGHHRIPGETFEWRTNSRTGTLYRFCLVCPADWKARKAQPTPSDLMCKRGHKWEPGSHKVTMRSNGRPLRQCFECYALRQMALLEGFEGEAASKRADELALLDRRELIAERVAALKEDGVLK